MKTRLTPVLIAAVALSLPASAQTGSVRILERHRTWIEKDVAALATPAEREAFLRIDSDKGREAFIEEFWRQRDPTPATPRNEFRTEHFRRLEFADRVFASEGGRGSDRGRIYVLLGSPREVRMIGRTDAFPMEIWAYQNSSAVETATLFRLLFYQPSGREGYKLYNPAADRPGRLLPAGLRADEDRLAKAPAPPFEADEAWPPADRLAFATIFAAAGPEAGECALTCLPGDRGAGAAARSAALLAALPDSARRRVDDRYAAAMAAGKALPEVPAAVRDVGGRSVVRAFADPDGSLFLHVALAPGRVGLDGASDLYQADLRSVLRLEDDRGRTLFERRQDVPITLHRSELPGIQGRAFQIYDAVPVIPGPAVLRYRLENTGDKTFCAFEQVLNVAAPGAAGPSEPLLGRRGTRVPPAEGTAPRAFRVGTAQIDPSVDGVFGAAEDVYLFVQCGRLSLELAAGGTIEAAVGGGAGAPRSVRRSLAELSDGSLLEKLPTAGLPAGSYAVDVRLVDKAGRALWTAKADLTLQSRPPVPAWIEFGFNPPPGDPYYAYARGRQAAARGDKSAVLVLADAWRAREDSIELATGYAAALLAVGDAGPARDVLRRYDGKPDLDFNYYTVLGKAAWAAGQVREAVDAFEKSLLYRRNAPEALNAIGDGRLSLGETAKAAEAWTKSLEVNPDQPDVRRKLEGLK